jgi:hypothetical protein
MAAEAATVPNEDADTVPVMDENESASEEEEKFKPAPLTAISPRPRPSRAARPAPPRPKSKEIEATIPSGPTTPTASSHRGHRASHTSFHADTEAWRESVATAAVHSEEWRESALTAAVPEPTFEAVKSIDGHDLAKPVPRLRKVASGASVGALVPSSPTPPVSANTTSSTMHSQSMSSAAPSYNIHGRFRPESRGGITTDGDSDADFQSAYSTSPRMTAGHDSEIEKSGSGDGLGYTRSSKRRSRQVVPFDQTRETYGLARPPSFSGTTLSTGAVGGLGLSGTETDSRSRASSIGTTLGEKQATSLSGSSDHTVGAPETSSSHDYTRALHPPVVSLVNRGVPANVATRTRRDSGTGISLTKPNGINVA